MLTAHLPELMRRIGHYTPNAAMRYQNASDDRDAANALSEFAEGKVIHLRPKARTGSDAVLAAHRVIDRR